jgi:RNA polymerase sigma-70 factor (ECF subfamily)
MDDALLAGLRTADPHSYEALVRRCTGRLLAVARRLVGNEDDARDCVQETFIQAFRHMATFEARAPLETWLHRIVVNAALMKIRARKRKGEEPLDGLLPEFDADGCRMEAAFGSAPPIEELLQRQGVRDFVQRAIARLPDAYRTVLVLRDIEEYDTEETARLLGDTPTAVKVRLHRARAALKKLVEPVLREESL